MVKKLSYVTIKLDKAYVDESIDPLKDVKKGLKFRTDVIKEALRHYQKYLEVVAQ